MIVISQIAQPPRAKDPKELVRFMLQSIDRDQEYHIKFLVGCMEHFYRKGKLTEGQMRAIISIYADFEASMRVQYPRLFDDPLPPPPEPESPPTLRDGNVVFFNKNKKEE